MKKSKSVKKIRADHYEKPLHIKGTFDDVIGVAMGKKPTNKKEDQTHQEEKQKEEDKK